MIGNSNFEDVGDFHRKFGLPASDGKYIGSDPGVHRLENLTADELKELLKFRINFIIEELSELVKNIGGEIYVDFDFVEDWTPEKIDHIEAFDALLDIAYVVFGMAHKLGYPWQKGWTEVQAKNMAKVRGAKDGSDSKRGSAWDVVKPEGWTPPDHRPALRMVGFDV